MRVVVTRVLNASVKIDDRIYSQIGAGLLVLLGISREGNESDARYLAKKVAQLRVFSDEAGKMNLSCSQAGGEIMVVPNVTLYADAKKGTRPSLIRAALPQRANALFEFFTALVREYGYTVKTGEFGADMKISSINDGPVTVLIDTDRV